jgi:hypothetical protein
MNFISHYYHELPVADDYFIAGVVLPDILSNFSKRHGSKGCDNTITSMLFFTIQSISMP